MREGAKGIGYFYKDSGREETRSLKTKSTFNARLNLTQEYAEIKITGKNSYLVSLFVI